MRFCIAICLLLTFLAPLRAGEKAAKRPITLEDLWKVKRLGKPSISPDGEWVAVDVTSYNMDDNSSNTQIWLCSTDGKTQKQLTQRQGEFDRPHLVARRQIDRLRLQAPATCRRFTSSPPTAARRNSSRNCR